MNKKVDYTNAEEFQKKTYFDCKVDMIPTSLKETYSDLVSKNPVLVSRELIVDNRPLIGIEYAPSGEVVSVYTTDAKGKRVNFENAAEDKNNTAPDLFAQRLAEAKSIMPKHTAEQEIPTPKAEKKKRVIPEALKTQQISRAQKSQQRA